MTYTYTQTRAALVEQANVLAGEATTTGLVTLATRLSNLADEIGSFGGPEDFYVHAPTWSQTLNSAANTIQSRNSNFIKAEIDTISNAVLGSASPVTFIGSINNGSGGSGTTLTVSNVTSGTITIGMRLVGGSVLADTFITGGIGSIWTVSKSQNLTSTSLYGVLTPATFTGTINGTILNVSTVASGIITTGMKLVGGSVLPNTFITGGSGSTWTVNRSQTLSSTSFNGVLIGWTDLISDMLTQQTIMAEKQTVMAEKQTVMAEKQTVMAEKQTVMADKQTIMADKQTIMADKQTIMADKQTIMADKQTIIADKQTIIADKQTIIADKQTIIADKQTVIADKQTVIADKQTAMETYQKKLKELGESTGIHIIGPYEVFGMIALYRMLIDQGKILDTDENVSPEVRTQAIQEAVSFMQRIQASLPTSF